MLCTFGHLDLLAGLLDQCQLPALPVDALHEQGLHLNADQQFVEQHRHRMVLLRQQIGQIGTEEVGAGLR